jgi:hypothetical protein
MFNLNILEQVCMEDSYSRDQTRSLVLKDMEDSIDEQIDQAVSDLFEYVNKTYSYESKNRRLTELVEKNFFDLEKIVNELMVIILPNKGTISIQTVVGKLASYLKFENQWDGIKTSAEIVVVCCHSDLYDVIPAANSRSGSIEVESNYQLSDKTLQMLSDFQYLPPMLCKPEKITNNYQSAYLSKNESIILGQGNHHDQYLALDAINIANSVELSLDEWVMTQEEVSKKPLDTQEKIDYFNRLKNSSKVIYKELVDKGNKFFLSWRPDKRGRLYSSGYHVNIQGSEYRKALINLANKQVIRLV